MKNFDFGAKMSIFDTNCFIIRQCSTLVLVHDDFDPKPRSNRWADSHFQDGRTLVVLSLIPVLLVDSSAKINKEIRHLCNLIIIVSKPFNTMTLHLDLYNNDSSPDLVDVQQPLFPK